MYDSKNKSYFSLVRKDILPMLPKNCSDVIELGCGDGGTLAWLKASGQALHTTGMELCAMPASLARTQVDHVIEGNIELTIKDVLHESCDLVLCLDVLEHLVDPWTVVQELYAILRPGGSIIISLPNVRNYRVVLPLLFNGTWRYQKDGIMDHTHLRFFSREGAEKILTQNGFIIKDSADNGLQPRRKLETWKAVLARTPLRDFCVFQFLLRAEKPLS
jgi:2-polyprenyl-3-methyl-5-hydroxy-6-metoxy-1,4-benzoquinol methylase